MLDTSNLSKFLKGITDAIRAKKGTTEPIEHKLIDEEIASIESSDIIDATYASSISLNNKNDFPTNYKNGILHIKLPNSQKSLHDFFTNKNLIHFKSYIKNPTNCLFSY